MKKHDHTITIILLLLGDFILLYAALVTGLFLRYAPTNSNLLLIDLHVTPFTIIFPVWLIIFGALGLYDIRLMKNGKLFLYRLLRAMAISTVVTIFAFYLTPALEIEPRRNLIIIALTTTLFIFVWRYLFNLLIIRTPTSRIIFFGISKEIVEFADYFLKNPQLGRRPVALFGNGNTDTLSLPPIPLYTLETDLAHVIKDTSADTIVVTQEIKGNQTLVKALFQVIPLGVSVVEFTGFHETLTGKIQLSLIGEIWFLENLIGIKKQIYEFFKRALDILLSVLLGILALMLYPLIAAAIKLDSDGPVWYRQERVGRHGRKFYVIKYRSMVKNADKMEGYKGEGPDPRHTRVGLFLRRSYLDELPQIINILKGEMSFVGPRPERPHYVERLKQKIPFYEMRLLVAPGITGWAQINMEDDASVEDAPEKMQYDLYYIKNRSLVLDLLIMLRTFFTIIRRSGR